MKSTAIAILVLVQLSVIIYLANHIVSQEKKVLGETYLNPIQKEDIVQKESGSFSNFYEPVADSVQEPGAEWFESDVKYTINNDTLNERFNYDTKKEDGVFRIVAIGDSFTFGEGVNTKDNYPEILEDKLNSTCSGTFEVINLGVGGYDIAYATERYRIRGLKYDPDLVIWFLKDDDFVDMTDVIVDFGKEEWEEHNKNQTVESFQRAIKASYGEFRKVYSYEEILSYAKINLNRLTEIYDGPLGIFTWEFTDQSYKNILYEFDQAHQNLFYLGEVTDVYELGHTYPDGHPDAEGYSVIASDVFELLKKSGAIRCQ